VALGRHQLKFKKLQSCRAHECCGQPCQAPIDEAYAATSAAVTIQRIVLSQSTLLVVVGSRWLD